MNRPLYPFLPALLFAIYPAYYAYQVIMSEWVTDFVKIVPCFLFIGIIGLATRQSWALWLHLVLWVFGLLLIFYSFYADIRHGTYLRLYYWSDRMVEIRVLGYLSLCFLSCWFGLWQCKRLQRLSAKSASISGP